MATAEAAPVYSPLLPPASPTAQPTTSLPTLKLGTMPVPQAIALFQQDIDTLNKEVAQLQTQNAQLIAQNILLQNQLVAQNVNLQVQISAIQKSLQPTPRPAGALVGPGVVTWSNLKNGGSRYDALLIPFFTNPGQQTGAPSGGDSTPIPLEHRLASPTPPAR